MIIYGSLLIPLIVSFVLYKYFLINVIWWELFIPLAASLIFIFIMKFSIEKVQVASKEYWGSLVDKIEYYEDWNEYIQKICTRNHCDSEGKNCRTETYNCSYVKYHSAYWQIVSSNKEVISISQNEYNKIKQKFNNEQFIELNRKYYTKNGNKYYSKWSNDSITAIPVTNLHHYENRVKAADQSVFHFKKVSKSDVKKYDLKSYPKITDYYKMPTVIGDSSEDALIADKKFQYINGLLGHKKQVRIFVLIFKNQPIDAAFYQESYWSGGNMNEFIICIGVDKERNVEWCKPISWTRSENLKTNVKNFVQSQQKLNLQDVADYIQKQADKEFVRRSFKEFNYLTVEPPMWAVIFTYLFTILINFGLSYWIINNDIK